MCRGDQQLILKVLLNVNEALSVPIGNSNLGAVRLHQEDQQMARKPVSQRRRCRRQRALIWGADTAERDCGARLTCGRAFLNVLNRILLRYKVERALPCLTVLDVDA